MLQQVILQSTNPMVLNIDQADPNEILVLKSISGLSNPKVNLFMGDFAREGGYYQGRRAQKLNPIFNLKINPDYKNDIEVSDIRELLYTMFLEPLDDSDGLQVVLKDDRKPDRFFVGYTEDLDSAQFSRETGVNISMLCTDAYLKSTAETFQVDPAGWLSLPFTYDGSSATGLYLTFEVRTATAQFNVDLNGKKMTLVGNFEVGDEIIINTNAGSRSIQRNGVDVMAMLTGSSSWLYLNRPNNVIKAYGTVENDGAVVLTEYRYRANWWGI